MQIQIQNVNFEYKFKFKRHWKFAKGHPSGFVFVGGSSDGGDRLQTQPQTAPVEASNFFIGDAAESKEGEE
jgi:hypothetical protein